MGVDPVSMAAIGSMAATAAGGGIKAFGAYEGGQATQAQMAYQAQVAQNNAAIAKQNASWDIQAGEAAANDRGMKTRAEVGTATAHLAAGGVATGVGSAGQAVAGIKDIGMLDSMRIRSNAARQAYSDEVQATSFGAQAGLDTLEGRQAAEGGDLGSLGTLLTTAGTFGSQYGQYTKNFNPPVSS
jgi:hypothetical protein